MKPCSPGRSLSEDWCTPWWINLLNFGKALIGCEKPGAIYRHAFPGLLTIAALCLLVLITLPGLVEAQGKRRGLETLNPSFQKSVLRGWRYFQTSFADDGVACVHCHRDHSDIVPWAGSYPKVQIFDGSPYRVKTLGMVIIETLDTHTDLEPSQRGEMAEDLLAYIAWWGDGQPLAPGISVNGMTPEEDLAELREAVSRGRSLFNRREPISCVHCHTARDQHDNYRKSLKDVFLGFPRSDGAGERTVSLDAYLLNHYRSQGVVMSGGSITDIAAYLADLSRGKLQRPGTRQTGGNLTP